jgi:hypothetical protein
MPGANIPYWQIPLQKSFCKIDEKLSALWTRRLLQGG